MAAVPDPEHAGVMTTTPTFRIEYRRVTANGRPVGHTPTGWDSKRAGRPTDERLAAEILALEESTTAFGVNAHLGRTIVGEARVIRQATGEIVASYQAPTFSVIA